MEKKIHFGTLLMIVFAVATGILFCCGRVTVPTDELQSASEMEAASEVFGNSSETGVSEMVIQTENDRIYVYVCGMVKAPDVYELESGARLFEAIEAAGGFCEGADLNSMNLADILEDGEKIYVPAEGETAKIWENTEDKAYDGRVNINTATAEQLQTLPGIGEAKANAIIVYRETNGAFASIEELRQVPGIKDGIYGQVQSLIRVD